ncbi:c-type cytochrome [Hyalangium versicolor]|uniref:c-type cytochrome n=1 Tax=Hyalangium versicolor TaxID=2861190 RepID=UPI001CCA0826|nr:c-type cytochrome [Hyalangium versicolor]
MAPWPLGCRQGACTGELPGFSGTEGHAVMRGHVPGEERWGPARLASLVALGGVLLSLPVGAAQPSPAAVLFTRRCATCHTLGEGDKVGPDLVGVLERREEAWITRFLQSPGALIDGGDPVAGGLLQKFNGVRMPDQQLTDEQRQQLFAYFRECTKLGVCKTPLSAKLASDATDEEIDQGRRLFEGTERLANGGTACVGCHDARGLGPAGGGTLAKDLTFSFARLGDRGMAPVLASMDLPMMRELYVQAPLTDAEQYALKAFLAQLSRNGAKQRPDRDFFYLGVVGLFATLGFIGVVRGGRKDVPPAGGTSRGAP